MSAAGSITLRPATAGDRFLIRRWLHSAHVERWWGDAAAGEARVAMAMQSPSALCRIILWDGDAIGYAHAVDASLWRGELPPDLAPGSCNVDLLVGSTAHLGRGAGQRTLELLTAEVFETTLALACVVLPAVANEAAVRSYERAGFRWRSIWHEAGRGPAWLMLLARPGTRPRAG